MRALASTCAALCLCIHACAGASRPPPGPRPIPAPPSPTSVVRERLARAGPRVVVLDDRDGLSPDEAAIMAIDQNPRLRAIRAERGIGRAELLAAGILPNPLLSGSLDFPLSGSEAKVLGYGAALSWNVTPLLSRGARVAAAEQNLASIDLEVAWQEWQAAQAARLHTIRTIYLERRLGIARELAQTWQQRLDAIRQVRAQGAVTELEVVNAERAHAEARVNTLELEQQLAGERAELNRALGVDSTKQVVLDGTFVASFPAPDTNRLLHELPRRRLDLIGLQRAHRSHDEALRAALIARFPPVEVGIHASRDVDDVGSAGVSLSFALPFFDRNQGAVARERAQRVQVEGEYEARLLEARTDIVRIIQQIAIVQRQLSAALESARAADRLAELASKAAIGGALTPLLAADILERSYAGRLRALEIEQVLAELHVALRVASGIDAP